MKRTLYLIAILLLLSLNYRAFAEEITIRLTNGEWAPYLSEHTEHYGIASRIVTEAFALEGIHVKYGFYPWNRSLMLAQKGRWDGTLVWAYSPERAELFYYSEPVIHSTWVFFHLKSTPFDWQTIEDLQSLKIGGTIGYYYGKEFQEAEEAGLIHISRIAEDKQNFIRLLKERIDIFLLDIHVGYTMLDRVFPTEQAELFTTHFKPVKEQPLSLLLSKEIERNKEIVDIFNRGLRQLQESGRINQYLQELPQVDKNRRQ